MKKVFILLFIAVIISSCSIVPITGRKQLKLLPSSQMNAMAVESYGLFLKENKVSSNQQQTKLLRKVGNNIRLAVEEYMLSQGQQKVLEGFDWEFNLIENKLVNAWAMPGGKIVFYTGILPICQNETGIAVVMSHEISHIIARHGNERMSQGLITQLGGLGLTIALKEKPQETRNLYLTAYGIGAQLGYLLPFSRTHELEADKIGLIFMAIAGYDPHAAPDFWLRMDENSTRHSPPEFLSTHPSHESRINAMMEFMPTAITYLKK